MHRKKIRIKTVSERKPIIHINHRRTRPAVIVRVAFLSKSGRHGRFPPYPKRLWALDGSSLGLPGRKGFVLLSLLLYRIHFVITTKNENCRYLNNISSSPILSKVHPPSFSTRSRKVSLRRIARNAVPASQLSEATAAATAICVVASLICG